MSGYNFAGNVTNAGSNLILHPINTTKAITNNIANLTKNVTINLLKALIFLADSTDEHNSTAIDPYMLESLQIVNLENNLKFKKDIYLSKEMIVFLKKIKKVVSVNTTEIDLLTRLILREKLWCMFASKAMSVRFGWDYYMYIGSVNKCVKGIQKIEKNGLFVEECDSSCLDV